MNNQHELLRAVAEKLDMRLGELAAVIGVRPRTVYGWSAGDAAMPPPARLLLQLLRDGKVTPMDLDLSS